MARKVDAAMHAARAEKDTVRQLWADTVAKVEAAGENEAGTPLYLTLAGAEGRDLQVLETRGLLLRTESKSVIEEHQTKFVAVENSPLAVLELQRRYPGLKIVDVPISNLLRSTDLTRWPDGIHRTFCRAAVVNLDLNEPLIVAEPHEELEFPALTLVQKFSQLHAVKPKRNWFLCLTLVGKIEWPALVATSAQTFLRENFEREPSFASACERLIGAELFRMIASNTADLQNLSADAQQRVLMAFVPKKIAQLVYSQGWFVKTTTNLRYGGSYSEARMVTWIIEFIARSTPTAESVYRESLRNVLTEAGHIARDGSVVRAVPVAA